MKRSYETLEEYRVENKRACNPHNGKEDLRENFIVRYASFRKLLVLNDAALELMADMEGRLSRGVAERKEIENTCERIMEKFKLIIDELNVLSENKYVALNDRFSFIKANIEELLVRKGAFLLPGNRPPGV